MKRYDELTGQQGYELLQMIKSDIEKLCSEHTISEPLKMYMIKLFFADVNFITDDLSEYIRRANEIKRNNESTERSE